MFANKEGDAPRHRQSYRKGNKGKYDSSAAPSIQITVKTVIPQSLFPVILV